METGLRIRHEPVRARGFARARGRDVEDPFARLFDAGAVDRVDAKFRGENSAHRAQDPALELSVIRGVEEDDGVCRVAVVGRLLLIGHTEQREDPNARLGRRRPERARPIVRAKPVVLPEIEQVRAIRRRPHADAVDHHVVLENFLLIRNAVEVVLGAFE